ncbi:MAG: glutathione S-transferase family protein [Rhodospirillales bacterium]|nr:glutathione S-transferase family protein [Rhodospirillales bacterium]
MADITLYGDARSSFTWTTRLACAEKGITHELAGLEFGSPEMLAMHPFGKIPFMRHGNFVLHETSAICRYIDDAFDGPPLQPTEIRERALMDQWISSLGDYFYDPLIRRYVLQYVFAKGKDGGPDRSVIDPAIEEIKGRLAIVESALDGKAFLAGSAFSIADMILTPILSYVRMMPEGADLMTPCPNVTRVHDALMARPSFAATRPQTPA